jgi:segregation and condensation protein A
VEVDYLMSEEITEVQGEQSEQQYAFEEEQNVLELKLSNFDGPLDLLLSLVKENKIEIKDIFVSQVTEQFLEYMNQVSELDVELASEYMAMAATLLEIKSRALLPPVVKDDEPEEETPEAVLIRQLEEYKLFKEIVTELKEQENVDRFYRDPDKNVGKEVSVIKENLSLDGFIAAFNKFLAKLQVKSQQSTTVSRTMARESFSVPQKINFIREVLKTVNEFKFTELFEPGASRNEYVTTFIAVLELTKLQIITIRQSDIFEDIVIVKREGSDDIHVDVEGEYEQVE